MGCCSQYGWCGTATSYCGSGCQPNFGQPCAAPPLGSGASASPSVTTSVSPSSTAAPTATSLPGVVIAPGTLIYQCRVPGTVAITFDDGPNMYTQPILDMLNAAGMKVTFFSNGNNW